MSLNFGVLPKVLFGPKQAFESIKDKTGMGDGIAMYIILTVLSSIIGIALMYATPMGAAIMGAGMTNMIISMVIGIIIGIVALVLIGYIASMIAAALGKGTKNPNVAIGFLGYGEMVSLVMSIIVGLLMVAGLGAMMMPAMGAPGINLNLGGALGAMMIVALVQLIWVLYVNGNAIAVANGVGTGIGVVSYFIAALIVGLIVGAIIAAVMTAMIGTAMMGATMGMMGV